MQCRMGAIMGFLYNIICLVRSGFMQFQFCYGFDSVVTDIDYNLLFLCRLQITLEFNPIRKLIIYILCLFSTTQKPYWFILDCPQPSPTSDLMKLLYSYILFNFPEVHFLQLQKSYYFITLDCPPPDPNLTW